MINWHHFSQASENNKRPIGQRLITVLKDSQDVFEIGSGSGQHAVYLAQKLAWLQWQPSEMQENLETLEFNLTNVAQENVKSPLHLDVNQSVWPIDQASAIFTANTLHIMSWQSVEALFLGVGRVLSDRGVLCVYGPFKYQGGFTTPSNAQFDLWLKQRSAQSGIRDIEAIIELAENQNLCLAEDFSMPANNQLLVFTR